jgi:hypothetical protein
VIIEEDLSSAEWDRALVPLAGHPWQSAHWGDARREVDGVVDHRWLLRDGDSVVQMLRFEERRVPGIGKIAWAPRGPAIASDTRQPAHLVGALRDHLQRRGFTLLVANPWRRVGSDDAEQQEAGTAQTIWLDLTLGKEQLWRNLSQQWRRNVGLARRQNVSVETTTDGQLIEGYFALCTRVSEMKGFELRYSPALIARLTGSRSADEVEAQLFVARCDGRIAAGALAFRCGGSIHYFGGASDRAFTKQHPGEAVHWSIVEWGLSLGCRIYDLEGIDPQGNPGTYAFKKKMGGEEVHLARRQVLPLSLKGQLLAPVATYALESNWASLPLLARSLWQTRKPGPAKVAEAA